MNLSESQQAFQQAFDGWLLGVSFVVVIVIILAVCGLFSSRWWRIRQANKHELAKIRLHAEMTRQGVDPDYLNFIEQKANDERK